MSHIDDLGEIAGLPGLAGFDQDEVVSFYPPIFERLGVASSKLAAYIADPGFGGAAGDAAAGWATAVQQSVQGVFRAVEDCLGRHGEARAVMREAASHLPELEAIMADAARLALSRKPGAIQQAIAMASGADSQAAQYIDAMNQALLDLAAHLRSGERGDDQPEDGTVYRSPSGDGSSGGSGSGGSGGGLPDYGPIKEWDPPQPPPPGPPPGPPYHPLHPIPPGPPWGPVIIPPWPPVPPPPPPPVPDPDVLKDWMAQHGMGVAAGAGLAGAAAVAAAVAYGSGGVASLAGLRGLSGVAPAGGVVSPGMAAPMGGAGGGQTGGKRKRRDYFAQHLDNPADVPPDPGWGARAGSVADLPPVPDVDDEEW